MIQSATLDAAFADFQDASCRVTRAAQRAAYVCLSRVKTMDSIQVLQPFSTMLFARGSPSGSDRLARKLSEDISSADALNEWMQDAEDSHDQETQEADPMKCTHRCTPCYLRGHVDYMHPAKSFGVASAAQFFCKYVSQGCWTRCLQCQKKAGIAVKMLPDESHSVQAAKKIEV